MSTTEFRYDDRTLAHEAEVLAREAELCKNPPLGSLKHKQFTFRHVLIAQTTVAVISAIVHLFL